MPQPSSPRPVRERLIAAAIALLEAEGPEALQARRLAAEIGASTMAVYTHFGGIPLLLEALVREGLVRCAAYVEAVPETDDPMADLIGGGLAYGRFALENPQLYRLMFGLTGSTRLESVGRDLVTTGTPWGIKEGAEASSLLVRRVERVIAARRIRDQNATDAAAQVLSVTHGFVLLAMSGFFGRDGEALPRIMVPLTINLMVGLGDDRSASERSLKAALAATRSRS